MKFGYRGKILEVDLNERTFQVKNLSEKDAVSFIGGAGLNAWIGMATDAFKQGILNKTMTDGLIFDWGKSDAYESIIDSISNRTGFGDTPAEGTKRAAEKIIKNPSPKDFNRSLKKRVQNKLKGHILGKLSEDPLKYREHFKRIGLKNVTEGVAK